ncbi:MAG: hypothetical protein ABI867_06135 [Kofleriaceae bacterium]
MLAKWIVVVVVLVGCSKGPVVQLVTSTCADLASCTAECDRGVVVACDRGGPLQPDPTERLALYKRAYNLWGDACNFGNPEACMSAATDLIRSRGVDPATMPLEALIRDPEACQYVEVWANGTGRPLATPCP